VGTTTVERPARSTKRGKAKNEQSGFSLKSWLAGPARQDDEPLPPTDPTGQSQWVVEQIRAELHKAVGYLAGQRKPPGAASPTDLDGSRPAYLLRHIAMLSLDGELRPEMTWRGAVELLQDAWDQLNARADEQETVETRTAAAMAAGLRVTRKLAEAAATEDMIERVTGERVELEIDTAAIGEGLARLHANAHRPLDETMQFPEPLYTPGMPDPRKADGKPGLAAVEVTQVLAQPHPWDAVASTDGMVRSDGSRPSSPVHRDDTAPPVPREDADQAGPPLPKRHKILSIPARMSAVPGVPADGSEHTATELLVQHGAWMLAGGVWSLVESAEVDAEKRVVAQPAEGEEVVLGPGAPVWLLAPGEAAGLVEAFRAGLNETEASR